MRQFPSTKCRGRRRRPWWPTAAISLSGSASAVATTRPGCRRSEEAGGLGRWAASRSEEAPVLGRARCEDSLASLSRALCQPLTRCAEFSVRTRRALRRHRARVPLLVHSRLRRRHVRSQHRRVRIKAVPPLRCAIPRGWSQFGAERQNDAAGVCTDAAASYTCECAEVSANPLLSRPRGV